MSLLSLRIGLFHSVGGVILLLIDAEVRLLAVIEVVHAFTLERLQCGETERLRPLDGRNLSEHETVSAVVKAVDAFGYDRRRFLSGRGGCRLLTGCLAAGKGQRADRGGRGRETEAFGEMTDIFHDQCDKLS